MPRGGVKNISYYLLTKKDSLLLASGYDVNLRAKIINRWEELENERRSGNSPVPDSPKSPFDLRLQLRYLTLCWHLGFNSQEIASMVSQMAREIDNDETFFQLVETVRREFKTADMALRCMMVEYGKRRGFAVPEPVEVISQKYIPHMLMTTEHLLALSGHSDITVERFYKALMDQGLLSRSRLYNLVDKQGNPRTEWEVTMAGDYYGRNAEMGGSFGYVRPMWWGDRFHQLLLESRVLEDYTGGSLIVCGEEVTE